MKFIKYLKKLILRKNVFKDINIGDLIWAKRYNTKDEMLEIEEGHREGPYLVISKNKNKLYCLPCTSNKENKRNDYFNLDKDKYSLDKDTIVKTNHCNIINPNRYIKYLATLDKEDYNKVNKKMYITKSKINTNIENDFIKFDISVGDIIYFDKNYYYISKVDEDYYYAYRINLCKNNKNPVCINGKNYSFNYESLKKVKKCKSSYFSLIEISSDSEIEHFNFLVDKYFKDKKDSKIIKRGKVIEVLNNNYYIYGEYENNWLLYSVYQKKKNDCVKIVIGKVNYYLDLEKKMIKKSPGYKIVRAASEKEMNFIKEICKSKNKSNKKSDLVIYKSKIQAKTIIKDFDTSEIYYVIKRVKNIITCVSYNDIHKEYKFALDKENSFDVIGKITNIEYKSLKLKIKK